jgi:hypothetical protein
VLAEIIALCALGISAAGLAISILSFRRVGKLEEPVAWAETTALIVENCWVITVHLRNPSTRYAVRLASLGVPITRVPVDDKQDFLLGDYTLAFKECENDVVKLRKIVEQMPTKAFKMSVPADTPLISPGDTYAFRALLFRGRLSAASRAKLTLYYYLMKENPSYRTKQMQLSLAERGLTFELQRV